MNVRALSNDARHTRHARFVAVNNSLDVGIAAPLWNNILPTCATWQYLHVEHGHVDLRAAPHCNMSHAEKRQNVFVLMRDDKQAFYSVIGNIHCENKKSPVGESGLGKSICLTGLLWSSRYEDGTMNSWWWFTWRLKEVARESVFVVYLFLLRINVQWENSLQGHNCSVPMLNVWTNDE